MSSLCDLCVLCDSVAGFLASFFTTKTQWTQRSHREKAYFILFVQRPGGPPPDNPAASNILDKLFWDFKRTVGANFKQVMRIIRAPREFSNRFTATPLLALLVSILIAGASCSYKSSEVARRSLPATKSNEIGRNNTGPVRYVALGDSTGAGVGATGGGYVARIFRRITDVREDSKLTNLCASGATSEDVLARQVNAAVAAKPTLVTIGIGINDIGRGFTPEQFRENLNEILTRLRGGTKASIVISNIPDISSAPRVPRIMRAETQRLIALFNKQISELALHHEASVADVYKDTHELLPSHPEYFSADGFHPSDEGYEVWAERMWPTVAVAIGAM